MGYGYGETSNGHRQGDIANIVRELREWLMFGEYRLSGLGCLAFLPVFGSRLHRDPGGHRQVTQCLGGSVSPFVS